jgi:hypothetical protein
MLRISSPDGAGRQVTYNRIFLFQQRYIAGEVHYSVNDKLLLRANVEVLENFQSIDPGMFTPPSAVTRLTPKKIVLDSKVVEQYRIKSASPQYIWEDNRFNLEGTVVLDATVGLDGRVGRVEVMSGLPSLRAPAIDLVKHATFRPVVVNGDPVEVEFVYRLVFCNGCTDRERSLHQGTFNGPAFSPSGASH